MDPLSITTGVLSAIGALSVTIDTFNNLKEAPNDIQELTTSLYNLNVVTTRAIEATRVINPQNSSHDLLCSVRDRLSVTCQMFEKHVPKNASKSLLRKKWITKKGEIKKVSKDIVAIRNDLNTALTLSTLLVVSQTQHSSYANLPGTSLERSTVFYPETYVIEQPLHQHLIVFSMRETHRMGNSRVDKYHVLYPNKRHWRRVTVVATTPNASRVSAVSATDLKSYKTLPGSIQTQLERFLETIETFTSITTVQIELEEDVKEIVKFNPDKSTVCEDVEEASRTETSRYVEEVRWRNLPQYNEFQVITLGREANSFFVSVESQICIEHKLPFYEQIKSNLKPVEEFVESMNLILSAQGCRGIPEFKGVIIEDGQLRGHLLQAPLQGPVWALMANALYANNPIPWARRERWFRQLLVTTADIHKRGILAGYEPHNSHEIWVDEHDDIKLVSLKSKHHDEFNITANLPPELRNTAQPRNMVSYQASMQTDIFNLGSILWAIAKHVRANVPDFCRWSNCPIEPTHWCTAEHTNPIALTSCANESIPAYVDKVIERCRQENPMKRSSAVTLLELLPLETNLSCLPPFVKDLAPWRNKERPPQSLACDKCGIPTAKAHYRCNLCNNGDFDICVPCYSIGVRCYENSHVLFRRVTKNGTIINESLSLAME